MSPEGRAGKHQESIVRTTSLMVISTDCHLGFAVTEMSSLTLRRHCCTYVQSGLWDLGLECLFWTGLT